RRAGRARVLDRPHLRRMGARGVASAGRRGARGSGPRLAEGLGWSAASFGQAPESLVDAGTMEPEPKLGLMRTAIIVWASGALAASLLAIFISPVAWALIAGSARHIDQQWGLAATLVVAN